MNKNRNEAAEEVENFYCFFNIIEPGVLYYTFYDEKILFYPHFFYSLRNRHPGSGIYQFPHWQVLTTSRPRLFIVDRVWVPIVGHFIPSICDLLLAFSNRKIVYSIPNLQHLLIILQWLVYSSNSATPHFTYHFSPLKNKTHSNLNTTRNFSVGCWRPCME